MDYFNPLIIGMIVTTAGMFVSEIVSTVRRYAR